MAVADTSPSLRRREPSDRGDERADRSRSKDDDDDRDDFDSKRDHHRDRRDRDRRKHRRRRRSSSSSSAEPGVGMSSWKLAMVVGVIVICFAMLYPKMFHPMLMGLLGMNTPPSEDKPFAPGPIHPAMSGRSRDSNMHPGMRMAAAQAGGQTSEGKGGGGKGMWSWMLPCYTAGVIVFLLYTLSKIMFKSGGRDKKKSRKYDMRYNSKRERFEVDGPRYSDEESDSEDEVPIGGTKMGKRQLRGLQSRLRHTESAMTKILEQLEQVSHATDPSVAEAAKKMTMDTLNQLSQVDVGPSTGGRSRGGKDDEISGKSDQYLQDLERALSEFKTLSEAYAETAAEQAKVKQEVTEGKNKESRSDNSSVSESEQEEAEKTADAEEDGHPLEPMESEDLDNLCEPEGVGEIIDLNANPPSAIASSVRKRH